MLYVKNSIVNITQTWFRNNRAESSGGSVYLLGTKANILNCTFEENYALYYGGALHCMNSFVYGRMNVFLNNSAKIHGGAVFGEMNTTFKMENTTFLRNKAVYNDGGSIGLINNNTLFANNCHFEKSSGVQSGVILAKTDSTFDTLRTPISPTIQVY